MSRLMWQGLDKWSKDKHLAKFIQQNFPSMSTLSLSKPPNKPFAFLMFTDDEQRQEFVRVASDLEFKDKKIRLKVIEGDERNAVRYRSLGEILTAREVHVQKSEPVGTLEDQVTPLWQTPYPEQLVIKRNSVLQAFTSMLQTAKTKIMKECVPSPAWISSPPEIPAPVPSPVTDAYRNKVEFSIGANADGSIEVGFIHGKMEDGSMRVSSAENCVNIDDCAKGVAVRLRKVLREVGLPAYDTTNHTGAWRTATFRASARTNESLLVLDAESHSDLSKAESPLLEAFPEVTSICIAIRGTAGSLRVIKGQGTYREQLLGKMFRISAKSFFQVNTVACELLYSRVRDLVEGDLLLDICCGTGTIGICCADRIKKVVGIELIEEAVVDARFNAEQNGVTAEYYVGRAENVIRDIAQQVEGQKVVGVVDPPRAGLHKTILNTLRTTKGLDRIIYVSCNPETMCNDLLDLCLPVTHKRRGPAFVPQSIQLVDLFPHTPHIESIVHLQRIY